MITLPEFQNGERLRIIAGPVKIELRQTRRIAEAAGWLRAFEAAAQKAVAPMGGFTHWAAMGRSGEMKDDVRAATLALLAGRAPGSTLCPSEVARAMAASAGAEDWRLEMPAVHAAIDSMVADGMVRLSWKGEAIPVRRGPYRIGRAVPEG